MLDPIADKLLGRRGVAGACRDRTNRRPVVVAAIVILCREILVSGLREYSRRTQVPVPVTAVAKWKTACRWWALGFSSPAGRRRRPPYATEDPASACFGSPPS